ncbi:hypothetical protein [Xanthomonas sp. 1678]|uniref:hypothetical protein n=1 Tax=Xanthomonas sp. 1678 TaxID=3158788 RepID=UPI002862BF9C|nr:hypothetical protein [Xanthomonas translucens]
MSTRKPLVLLDDNRVGELPAGDLISGGRIALTMTLNLYVSTIGDDDSDGLTPETPFRTIQRAVDVVLRNYDLSGHMANINVADGIYTEEVLVLYGSAGAIRFAGSTAANWRGVGGYALRASFGSNIRVAGFTFGGGTIATYHIGVTGQASLILEGGSVFGAAASRHILVARQAYLSIEGGYTITDGANSHIGVLDGSMAVYSAITTTLTGTPSFSAGFVVVGRNSSVNAGDAATLTFNGAATGPRYAMHVLSSIWTGGKGANLFPGSTAGTATTGSVYS